MIGDTIEVVKKIMKTDGITQTTIGKRLGKDPHVIGDRLRQKTITTRMLSEILRTMDYKIVIMPAGQQTPKGGYEIE